MFFLGFQNFAANRSSTSDNSSKYVWIRCLNLSDPFIRYIADFILLRRSSKLSETLRTAMQTQPIRATAPEARTREEIFAVEISTGAADKYFRIGPGGQPNQAGRSLPLSNGCRLTLHPCCERVIPLSPGRRASLPSEGGRELGPAAWAPGLRVQGARRPCEKIGDPHGEIAGGQPATGYGRVR